MTQIFTARTVEDAKALASRTFGADEEEIQFEILEEPKKGLFFGRLKGEAKIRATYVAVEPVISMEQEEFSPGVENIVENPVEEPVINAELEEFSTEVEKSVEIPEEEPIINIEPEEISTEVENDVEILEEEPVINTESEEISTEVEKPVEIPEEEPVINTEPEEISTEVENDVEIPVQELAEYKKSAPVLSDTELITGEPSEQALQKIERAKTYLQGILNTMGIQAELKVNAGGESALIDIQAGKNGAVIGKHGDTLDALQYLTFMIANHGDKEYYRIILNSANYRERRRKTLEELATKIAKNVLRTGRQTTLEPMNPYERRIIHSVIAEIDGVTSKSTGEEPYRKVIISSENPSVRTQKNYRDRGRRNSNRRHNKKHGDNYRKKNQEITPSRISMDSMKTSFEKDYKRPRPEDELNAGLYGKIEF
ncbi:MAG: Jag N-terminal domain-containing protein [Oscillospiraceae bacterium]|nr:Jag N-terminal domain-containing protein [Oscillospiraceae bacterium]